MVLNSATSLSVRPNNAPSCTGCGHLPGPLALRRRGTSWIKQSGRRGRKIQNAHLELCTQDRCSASWGSLLLSMECSATVTHSSSVCWALVIETNSNPWLLRSRAVVQGYWQWGRRYLCNGVGGKSQDNSGGKIEVVSWCSPEFRATVTSVFRGRG